MKITPKLLTVSAYVEADLTDAPVMPAAYSRKERTFRPNRIEIDFHWDGHGWTYTGRWDIKLSGPELKKDGTEGQQAHRGHPVELQPWIAEIANRLRPTHTPDRVRAAAFDIEVTE